jgi:ribosomal protein S27AE
MYWLYWGGDVDLSALDKRVREGIYTDHDFEGAVKTQYSLTVCPVCGSQWDTLIIPPGDPYLGAPGLYEKKVEEWVRKIRGCPACGARLRQLVVQVLGEHGRQ